MNKIYKVVWNKARNCYVVGSEFISSHSDGKGSAERVPGNTLRCLVLSALISAAGVFGAGVAASTYNPIYEYGDFRIDLRQQEVRDHYTYSSYPSNSELGVAWQDTYTQITTPNNNPRPDTTVEAWSNGTGPSTTLKWVTKDSDGNEKYMMTETTSLNAEGLKQITVSGTSYNNLMGEYEMNGVISNHLDGSVTETNVKKYTDGTVTMTAYAPASGLGGSYSTRTDNNGTTIDEFASGYDKNGNFSEIWYTVGENGDKTYYGRLYGEDGSVIDSASEGYATKVENFISQQKSLIENAGVSTAAAGTEQGSGTGTSTATGTSGIVTTSTESAGIYQQNPVNPERINSGVAYDFNSKSDWQLTNGDEDIAQGEVWVNGLHAYTSQEEAGDGAKQITTGYSPDENGNITMVLMDKAGSSSGSVKVAEWDGIYDPSESRRLEQEVQREEMLLESRGEQKLMTASSASLEKSYELPDGQTTYTTTLTVENEDPAAYRYVTLTNIGKASDIGDVSEFENTDLANKDSEGNVEHTTVVDAVLNLNNKVDATHTEVTVNGGTEAPAAGEDGAYGEYTAGNLQLAQKKDENGKVTYDVKLAQNIDLGADGSVTTGQTVINNDGIKVSNTNGAVTVGTSSLTTDTLKVGGNTYIDSKGINANSQKITNVKAGDISSTSTDAVNGSQLYATNQQVINNSSNITNLYGDVNKLDSRIKRVGAGAAALAALHPLDFDPDAKWDFAAGYGNYRGANAVAVGTYYRPNEDTMFSIGGTFGGGENMINAGVSLKIGASSSHVNTSKVAMAKEIKDMRAELEALKSALLDANAGKKLDTSKLQLFPDVPENHWAYEYVATLAGNGIIEGYPDGTFSGDRPMTRYEFAAMLYRAMLNGATLSDKILAEFAPELERFTVDTIYKDKDGNPTVERVRTIKNAK